MEIQNIQSIDDAEEIKRKLAVYEAHKLRCKQYYQSHKDAWRSGGKYIKFQTCDICNVTVKKDHFNIHHCNTKKHKQLVALKAKFEEELEKVKSTLREKLTADLI